MTNTVNNTNTNGLLNGGHRNHNHPSLVSNSINSSNNGNRHHYRNSGTLVTSPADTFSTLFEPPVSVNSLNSTGSLSSSSTTSSTSSSSSGSYFQGNQMNEELQAETTADRLEQNSYKFNKTPYRDDNCKNEWLSTKAREILGELNLHNMNQCCINKIKDKMIHINHLSSRHNKKRINF